MWANKTNTQPADPFKENQQAQFVIEMKYSLAFVSNIYFVFERVW